MDNKALELECRRLEALQECRNVMGRYSQYNSQVRRVELIGLFSKRDDVMVEMPWGIYDGPEGLKHRYLDEQGDRGDPVGYKKFVGKTVSHEMDTEILEVADDCMTARGCWISPGCDTGYVNGKGEAMWCWSKFACDFIFEDGKWKLWHMRLYHMLRSNFNEKWTDCKFQNYPAYFKISPADREATDPDVWEAGKPYPLDQPEPPAPYSTFAEASNLFIRPKEA